MVAPFLLKQSLRARRASPLIRRAVREGVSSRQLTQILRDAGLGIRRQTLLDLMRHESERILTGPVLSALRLDRMPNPMRLPPALTKIRRAYSFTVRVRGEEFGTGIKMEQFVTITTDKLLTRGEIESLANLVVEKDLERYGLDIATVTLIGGQRAGPEGLL